jgi:hypothetical protein
MDAENLYLHATVRLASPASEAAAAGQVRIDDYRLAGPERTVALCVQYFAGKLVADDPGILEVRVAALEDVEIGPTNADAAHLDQHV